MPKKHLTKTNKMTFARYWSGSIRETVIAMNKDGVKMAYRTCQRYIADPEVQSAIRANSCEKMGVIQRDRIQAYWTAVMRDDSYRDCWLDAKEEAEKLLIEVESELGR